MLMRFAGYEHSHLLTLANVLFVEKCRGPLTQACKRRLVIETIPQHKDFPRTSTGRKPALPARYREFQKV